jgi:hypothetical protein
MRLAKAHPRHHLLDYSDAEALARLVDELGPDHLLPGCNDRSYISCAAVAAGRGLSGLDTPENTRNINDKAAFRDAAGRLGLGIPRVWDWPREMAGRARSSSKPVDAFSGKGITIVRRPDRASLEAAVRLAGEVSRSGRAIVEEFVEGQLHSHSAFVAGGRIVQDFWVIEHCSVNPFVVDVSHLVLGPRPGGDGRHARRCRAPGRRPRPGRWPGAHPVHRQRHAACDGRGDPALPRRPLQPADPARHRLRLLRPPTPRRSSVARWCPPAARRRVQRGDAPHPHRRSDRAPAASALPAAAA